MECGNNEISSKIQFLQQNVDRNPHKMHTCLEIELELKIDYILFQEPYINMTIKMTISHSAYYCIMPESEHRQFPEQPEIFTVCGKSSRSPGLVPGSVRAARASPGLVDT